MPSGKHLRRARSGRPPSGMTYLLLLFLLALGGAGLAALGQSWQTATQREREAELLFRGGQFAQALASWRDTPAAGRARAPRTLQELLSDERVSPPRHHLRQLYTDPFTGLADWELQRDPQGLIEAVSSRSRQPALRRQGVTLREGSQADAPLVGDWLFAAEPALVTAVEKKGP